MEPKINSEATQSTPEQERELTRYEVIAEQRIAEASKKDPLGQLNLMKGFVDEIRQEAAAGYIKSSAKGEKQGAPYTAEEFDNQLFTFVRQINLPEEKRFIKDPFMAIPSSEGLRKAFVLFETTGETAQALLTAIKDTEVAQRREHQLTPESTAELTSERLTDLMSGVGHKTLEVVGVEPVAPEPVRTETDYDDFLNGDSEGSVEDAAIRPVETEADRLTRERRTADAEDAANKAYKRPEMNE